MKDPRVAKLANTLLTYSVRIQPGEKLMIETQGPSTQEIVQELITRCTELGGIPLWVNMDARLTRRFLKGAKENQIKAWGELHNSMMKQMDAYLAIRDPENVMEMSDLSKEANAWYGAHYRKPVHMETRLKQTKWCVLRWPNNAMAQLAETSQEAFEDYYFNVCNLDYAKFSKAMHPLHELMQRTDKVRIVAPHTDLTFSIKNIPAIQCDGQLNIPDGEIFTAPVRESVNGTIQYNCPTIQDGTLFKNIRLQFKNGKIVEATCDGDNKKLNAVFDIDSGARYVGEFAIGLNPHIHHPMKDILFDEKIYGSIHMAMGNAYDEAPNGNSSALHWDLVLIQTPEYGGGELYFDDKLIRKDGEFLLPQLQEKLSRQALLANAGK